MEYHDKFKHIIVKLIDEPTPLLTNIYKPLGFLTHNLCGDCLSDFIDITKLKFKASPSPTKPSLQVDIGRVVVFVGPNNSGKSLALKEIENWCFGSKFESRVIDSVEVDIPNDFETAEKLLKVFESDPPPNQGKTIGSMWVAQHRFRSGQQNTTVQVHLESLKNWINNKNTDFILSNLVSFYTVRLDGRTRFSLTDPKPTGDLQQTPQNHLWALFKNDKAREQVRKLTEEAFPGNYFVIDPTSMNNFRIRLSPREPTSKSEEQALDEAARDFHANAPLISEFSDGVQAFVGLISAVLSLPHKIILVDEPDAFLHPPLARRLGSNLTNLAQERHATLICATHSPEFLIGCIESNSNTSIVRLTYRNNLATARNLTSSDVSEMATDPLLRSTNLLNALFHTAAVITESDTDRAFYDEINRRMVSVGRGLSDVVFLNAQNWQTIRRLVRPLRKLGIPAVAIIDLDMILNGGTNWRNIIEACQIPASVKRTLDTERDYFSEVFSKFGNRIKKLGINGLDNSDKARAELFLSELENYGLFLVPRGELESWLPSLKANGHGAKWLDNIFEKMGSSDSDSSYLKPGKDDVWEFIDSIAKWVNDSDRSGTE